MNLSTAKSHQKGCTNPAVGTSQIRFWNSPWWLQYQYNIPCPRQKKRTSMLLSGLSFVRCTTSLRFNTVKTIRLASPIFLEQEICHGKIQKCHASRIKHRDVGIAFTTRSLSKNEITKLSTDSIFRQCALLQGNLNFSGVPQCSRSSTKTMASSKIWESISSLPAISAPMQEKCVPGLTHSF